MSERFTRREFLRKAGRGSVAALLAACAPRMTRPGKPVEFALPGRIPAPLDDKFFLK